MTESVSRVRNLLHEVAELHHAVYRIVDGTDSDWPSWYSKWLVTLSELPEVLDRRPARSELTWLIVQLDKDYTAAAPDVPWEDWYAERLVRHFSG